MKFSERLAAAKAAPKPTSTVRIVLDADVSEKRRALELAIENAQKESDDARLSEESELPELNAALEALEDEFAAAMVTLRFTRMNGEDWARLVVENPPRENVPIDQFAGHYNVHGVTRAAAIQTGVVVEGDEEYKPSEDEWEQMFSTISGFEFEDISDTLYTLNQGAPMQAISIAVKASAATRD